MNSHLDKRSLAGDEGMMSDDQHRMQHLEELVAHQTAEIESLSEQVREQWDKIDTLTKALLRLRDRVTEVEEGGGAHENTPPPHY
ncbi:MAG: SlyX family protein [Pseudomonadota bacterium]